MTSKGWIGVDLDGTLAEYDGWVDIWTIGAPVAKMVARVRRWLDEDIYDVKIFTARAAHGDMAVRAIELWCEEHLGVVLPVTNVKDLMCVRIYDDRATEVFTNTGETWAERYGIADAA